MKLISISIIGISFILLSFSIIDNPPTDDDFDWNSCIEKYKSEWGEPCQGCTYSSDIYKAYFKNVCDKKVDVLISVQEENNTWNCYYFNDLAPNDTVVAHACRGNGKYLIWVKEAGNKEIVFPKCHEVNDQY